MVSATRAPTANSDKHSHSSRLPVGFAASASRGRALCLWTLGYIRLRPLPRRMRLSHKDQGAADVPPITREGRPLTVSSVKGFKQGHQGPLPPPQLSGKGATSGNWRGRRERQRPAPDGGRADARFRNIFEEHAKSHRDRMAYL